MVSKLQFIFTTTVFFLFIIQMSAILGVDIISSQIPSSITPPSAPNSIIDIFGYIVSNFGIFFQLMTVSSTFLIFGSVILTAYVISMIWVILELVRGI